MGTFNEQDYNIRDNFDDKGLLPIVFYTVEIETSRMINSEEILFVLIKTTHPGNIGASARAIKNMGFKKLCLVSPANFPNEEAVARCSGAEDILEQTIVVEDFKQAIAHCNLVFGASARIRALSIPSLSAHDSALKAREALREGNKIGFLFGQERMGLTNEELSACHYHVFIPCNPDFASLNLAQAVQVVAYELHKSLLDVNKNEYGHKSASKVTLEDMEHFYQHLEKTLIDLHFLDPHKPRQMMRKLRRLFNRISLERNELNILRGILTAVNREHS